MRWPKYWSFSFNISPSSEYPGLISIRMDWLDLLAVQGTLKCLLQYHSSKAPILQHSALFTVQLSHPYMTTGKTISLTRRTFVGKVMSLLFNMLSRLVINVHTHIYSTTTKTWNISLIPAKVSVCSLAVSHLPLTPNSKQPLLCFKSLYIILLVLEYLAVKSHIHSFIAGFFYSV